MKTGRFFTLCALLPLVGLAALLTACTTAPAPAPTPQSLAATVDDLVAIGLVPVLTKNPAYLPAAAALGDALGTFEGETLAPGDAAALVALAAARVPALAPADRKTIAALLDLAWSRYAAQVGAGMRPDVKLFLGAVGDGLRRAAAAAQ